MRFIGNSCFTAGIYLFNANNRNIKIMCEICFSCLLQPKAYLKLEVNKPQSYIAPCFSSL